MELKTYQKNVLGDLTRFLTLMTENNSAAKAYKTLWERSKSIQDTLGRKRCECRF